MSDLSASLAPNLASVGLSPQSIDNTLQRISGVEQSWGMPAIPDDVKFDLATHPEFKSADDVTGFLYGVASDLNPPPKPKVIAPNDLNPTITPIRNLWAGLAGQQAPEVIDPLGVRNMKVRAMAAGLLPDDTIIDNKWSPELSNVKWDLWQNDYQKRMAGEKPGSFSIGTVMKWADEWLSPSGLISAAVAMDYLPDIKQIGREFQGWGDKFRKFARTKSPKDFIDALTGPIDDVVLPVFNDMMLLSGVSEVVGFVRAANIGIEAASAMNAAEKAYSGVRAAQGLAEVSRAADFGMDASKTFGFFKSASLADRAAEFEKFTKPLEISSRLGAVDNVAAQKTANLMAAWRGNLATATAKKGVQQLAKLGLVGTAESKLFPNMQGTNLLRSHEPLGVRLEEAKNFRTKNPVVGALSNIGDVLLAPPSILKEGAFTKPVKSAIEKFKQVTTELAADEKLTATFSVGLHDAWGAEAEHATKQLSKYADSMSETRRLELEGTVHRFEQFQKDFKKSPTEALVKHFANGDREQAGHMMHFYAVQAAAHHEAMDMALNLTAGSGDPATLFSAYHMIRSSRWDQLRPIALTGDGDYSAYAWVRSRRDLIDQYKGLGGSIGGKPMKLTDVQSRYAELMERLNHADEAVRTVAREEADAFVVSHNDARDMTFSGLLDRLKPGDIEAYMRDSIGQHGGWEDYTGLLSDISLAKERGELSAKQVKALKLDGVDEAWNPFRAQQDVDVSDLNIPWSKDQIKKAWVDPLKGGKDLGFGDFTIQRVGTLDRREAQGIVGHIDQLIKQKKALQEGDVVAGKLPGFTDAIKAMTPEEWDANRKTLLQEWAQNLPGKQDKKSLERYADAVRWAQKHGFDPNDAVGKIDQDLERFNQAAWWQQRFGVKVADSIEDKNKKLKRLMQFIPQEVEGPEWLTGSLGDKGYKLVHGVNFLMPSDIGDLGNPIAEITQGTLRKRSLGTFLDPQAATAVSHMRMQNLRDELESLKLGGHLPKNTDTESFIQRLVDFKEAQTQAGIDMAKADKNGTMMQKVMGNVRSAQVPFDIFDISGNSIRQIFNEYDDVTARRIAGAIKRSVPVGFEYRGLQHIEDWLKANSVFASTLKLFGESQPGLITRVKETSGAKRALTGVAGAALSGAVSEMNGGSFGDDLKAAAIGGAVGAAAPGVADRKLAARMITGGLGAVAGAAVSGGNQQAMLAGGLAGFAGTGAAARRIEPFLDRHALAEYGRLSDFAVRVRDYMRFSISPYFDIQNRSEGYMRNILFTPEDVKLPWNTSNPKSLERRLVKELGEEAGKARATELINDYHMMAHGGRQVADATDAASRFFTQRSIFGYSPQDSIISSYGHLVHQGYEREKAFEVAQKIYEYGGRSPLELSVNTIFFPFSYGARLYGNTARYLTHDLGRLMILHDALKTYDLLNEHYDLNKVMKEHMPLLQQLQQMNQFSQGVGLGVLGGVNRKYIDVLADFPGVEQMTNPIINLFLPQGVKLSTEPDSQDLIKKVQKVLPLIGQLQNMARDLGEQGHVLFNSQTHKTTQAETQAAYAEWNAWKKDADARAQAAGYDSFTQMAAKDPTGQVRAERDIIKQQIEDKYPGFYAKRALSSARINAAQEELKGIQVAVATGESRDPKDIATAAFQDFLDQLQDVVSNQGLSLTGDFEDMPEDIQNLVRNKAIALVKSKIGGQSSQFELAYKHYWERTFGPITSYLT